MSNGCVAVGVFYALCVPCLMKPDDHARIAKYLAFACFWLLLGIWLKIPPRKDEP